MAEEAAAARLPPPPFWLGPRPALVATIGLAFAWACFTLEPSLDRLVPGREDLGQLSRFLLAAFEPALRHTGEVPADTPPLLAIAGAAAAKTLIFAASGMSLAVVLGTLLGFLGASVWWADDPATRSAHPGRWLPRIVGPALYGATRVTIALMRSVHELIWALLFLAAVGLSDLSAVLAIAIPYGGTLAKVFSEALDEAPRDAASALRAGGASAAQVVLFALVPRALPDISAYAMYRFECAVRSSAVLGFFGWATLGYHIRLEWGMADYREVWTYLYTLLALVALLDWWSGALRRRFVA